MARPLSEEKQDAILEAATTLIAANGVGASTAAIAKMAKVAEGTLFTYFTNKDVLLNQLYLRLSEHLAESLAYVPANDPREVVTHILGQLIAWGVQNPARYQAKNQLKVSERITPATRAQGAQLFRESHQRLLHILEGRIEPDLASFYVVTVLPGLADVAIEAIAAQPQQQARLTQASIDLWWKGVKP
ncbi:TetR/AcrR family transcriptional regulator [Musicola paradisiaca]|uniref:Transcriptional regulator, TetR family n=1 Tax=Musicola paradisiaca (strain Ech703) TaxID=579405 RepID=C6C3Q0_MUSP7|nr:TetR/AcrR family transcriptional regulator [Musicola paradisiaca]ACS85395.1 transcriptional regulator, TetR family [Musicola paradisiaca Ech703]